ncbi:MAG: Bacterial rane flanked domain family [Herbinix sp.]|nr:Bacterial rane flanked domain family [Herbinix sp.]
MEFKHVRGSALILFDRLLKIPSIMALVIISFIFYKELDFNTLYPILILAFSPLTGFMKYSSTYYTLEDGHIIVESGIFHKKRMEIPFWQVTTVDLSQNIIYQLFKTYRVKIDNASQGGDSGNNAEVLLALKREQAFEFKRIITREITTESIEPEYGKVITASSLDFLKLGLLQSKLIYFFSGAPIAVPLITGIGALFTGAKSSDEFLDTVVSLGSMEIVILEVAIFFYLIALMVSVFSSLLTYYDFKISGDANTLKVQYGLLTKRKYTLPKRKINGVVLKQNLLMRLFHCYRVEVLVIGYGDESDDELNGRPIIYPIASIKQIKRILWELLPDYELADHPCRPDKKAIRYFFLNTGFVIAVLIFIASLFTKDVIFIMPAAVLVIFAGISVILQYLSTGIFYGANNITLSSGGYHRTITLIRTASIESFTAESNLWKMKNGIVSISIGFMAPALSAQVIALNLPVEQYQLLEKGIEY